MAKDIDESLYRRPEEKPREEAKKEPLPKDAGKDEKNKKEPRLPEQDQREEDWSVPEAPQPEGAAEDDGAPAPEKPTRTAGSGSMYASDDGHGRTFKRIMTYVLIAVLFIVVAVMTLSNFVDHPALQAPKRIVSTIISPVQKVFSTLTGSVTSYFRTLKVRGNIEYEYEQLLGQIDDLASRAAMADEYRRQVEELYDLMGETQRNTQMDPVIASVIAHDNSNYFSVLTVDVGARSGIRENMAVVFSGGLVGYTYDVTDNACKVLCVIDGNATVAAMVQSTRDQGSIKGTLSIDGSAMCRMYYLPENSLPRPGDLVVTSGVGAEFPKGIPIGYVRESTRGMDENKSFVVVEPIVDFQHLEYVVIYRYRPAYAEAVQQRTGSNAITAAPLITARPQPTFRLTDDTVTPTPVPGEETVPPEDIGPDGETPIPDETPIPGETPIPDGTAGPDGSDEPDGDGTPVPSEPPENLTYQTPVTVVGTPTPSPTPEPTPTPTPAPTFDPNDLTIEDD
ncbi:MAG: rod shape-determining protein MreC [Clostridia bacterium]|nr:rod shape-determining protein MreC [Clostridia bacterium]